MSQVHGDAFDPLYFDPGPFPNLTELRQVLVANITK